MPYIEIIEKDETSAGVLADVTDVVYIPGFVDVTQECLYEDGKYVGIEVGQPTLFTSIQQFESLCGKRAAVFSTTQYYTDLNKTTSTGFGGFAANATPYHRVMFSEGTADPSYIMAKEYLNAGLNVLYERVNATDRYKIIVNEPTDWDTNYNNYYTKDDVYTSLADVAQPPLWYKQVPIGTKVDKDTIYYQATWEVDDSDRNMYNIASFDIVNIDDVTNTVDGVKTISTDDVFIYTEKFYEQCLEVVSLDRKPKWVENKYSYKGESGYLTLERWQNLDPTEDDGNVYVDVYTPITEQDWGDPQPHMNTLQEMVSDWGTDYHMFYRLVEDCIIKLPLQEDVPKFTIMSPKHKTRYIKIDDISITTMYEALEGLYDTGDIDGLADKGNYSIKYLTSGGYPVYEYNNNSIVSKMINLAVTRGDCVAFIDHTDHVDRDDNIDHKSSVYATVSDDQVFKVNGEFATMFTPWASYNRVTSDRDDEGDIIKSSSVRMPASYAYFLALGDSIRTNANWLAIAGSARGVVPNLSSNGMTTNIPNGAADKMQPRDGVAVNAITNIKPYGYTIWGNRTLKNNGEKGNLTATSFLNVRNLISDVKKLTYRVARQLTFEQNNEILWINFKSLIAPTLDRMLSGYGISGYKIIRDTAHEKASEKATVCAKIILYPVYAVEDFYITVVLKDDEVSVE